MSVEATNAFGGVGEVAVRVFVGIGYIHISRCPYSSVNDQVIYDAVMCLTSHSGRIEKGVFAFCSSKFCEGNNDGDPARSNRQRIYRYLMQRLKISTKLFYYGS
eukprot:scaffold20302_cov185-Amphora_coffeaeformis.AAC.3